jgi:hypothetical protein
VPLYQESPTIAAIDDISGALSAQRESVLILAQRWRKTFRTEDFDELQRILDACDRIQGYHLIVRATESSAYRDTQEKPSAS